MWKRRPILDEVLRSVAQSFDALGPIASFAGDADSLRQSLARNDLRSARSRVGLLQADASAVDQALKQHPNSTLAAQWSVLRVQADKLAGEIREDELSAVLA